MAAKSEISALTGDLSPVIKLVVGHFKSYIAGDVITLLVQVSFSVESF